MVDEVAVRAESERSHRLLVVDDDPAIRFALQEFFTAYGYFVDVADSLAGARQRIAADEIIDAVVCDYRLSRPYSDEGLEVLRCLRAARPEVPAILLSAYASQDVALAATEAGATMILSKPIDLPALAEILDRLVTLQAEIRRARGR
jgi:DNA-binding NtrC family response regulator